MNHELSEDATVTYSVRDLLGEIRDDVKDVKSKLDTKVDKVDFVEEVKRIDSDISIVSGRVRDLEHAWWQSKPLLAGIAAAMVGGGFGVERLLG